MWQAKAIVAVMTLYTVAVVAVARGARRQTGRSPWGRPGAFEAVIMAVWSADFVVWWLVPVLMLTGTGGEWIRPVWVSGPASAIGLVLATIACGISWAAWRRLGAAWKWGTDPRATRLVTDGIYAWMRHPIYTAQALLLVGSVLMLPTRAYFVMSVVHLACLYGKARLENARLSASHGDAYASYACRRSYRRSGRARL
jgi:protein-S-isoprenylcysteine O-methyltransferase Ste14